MINKVIKFWDRKQIASDTKRYDKKYIQLEKFNKIQLEALIRLENINMLTRPVYSCLHDKIKDVLIDKNLIVLELGSGFGMYTSVIANTGVKLTILDISEVALKINNRINPGLYKSILGSIDSIPLPNQSVDVVIICNSLSYANPKKVNREILRVLKQGGSLIVSDALDHNVIYRINRLIKILIGARSINSVFRIPKMSSIKELSRHFEMSEITFFGKWLWLLAPIIKLIPRVSQFNQKIDSWGPNRLAFQFVLVCKSYSPDQRKI